MIRFIYYFLRHKKDILFDLFLRNFVQFKFINFNNIFLKIKKNNKLRKYKHFRYKKIYILGSANSILKLSKIQKKEISKYPTISINGYLLFWEKVGFWPDYHFQSDFDFNGPKVLNATIKKIVNIKKKIPIFIINKVYRYFLPFGLNKIYFNYFRKNLKIAKNFDEDQFGCHGSLSTLINILVLLKLSKRIYLVGIELNKPGRFFDEELKKKNMYNWNVDKPAFDQNMHATLKKGKDGTNILTNWHILDQHLKKNKIKLYSLSKTSEFVKSNYAEYKFK